MLRMTEPTPTTRAGRIEAQRRKAAERARRYRDRQKSAGVPNAAAIDKAVSEAVAFLVKKDGVNIEIKPRKIMRVARIILEREGHPPEESVEALKRRLIDGREEHQWPDQIPSLNPGPADRFRETKAGPWQTPIDAILRFLAGNGAGTASRPE